MDKNILEIESENDLIVIDINKLNTEKCNNFKE